ncbi:hypothetical protein GIW81_02070 [Hyphomicrobium sp. xq]|uniref:Transposase n=1 Tax=Hyphomicrobium album TaxID=2665159 RepID=A0A6I3KG21_9HYPH|nr:hypothetical protein [Hyphomicrobium album]MTD93116.1 hypothetical protein [Hyphomicrobium album]
MNRLRMSHAFNPMMGRWIAIVSDKHIANGDRETNVLAVEFLGSEEACYAWFERVQAERPWERLRS